MNNIQYFEQTNKDVFKRHRLKIMVRTAEELLGSDNLVVF